MFVRKLQRWRQRQRRERQATDPLFCDGGGIFTDHSQVPMLAELILKKSALSLSLSLTCFTNNS